MKKCLFRNVRTTIAAVLALGAAVPAAASASAVTSASAMSSGSTITCPTQQFSQPWMPWGDSNWYTLLPGESADNVDGTGWLLGGGAKLVTTTLQDGATGQVLDIPGGGRAVSPVICISAAYPSARTWIKDVKGLVGVKLAISYQNSDGRWGAAATSGAITTPGSEWGVSGDVALPSSNLVGTAPARFTFTGWGAESEYQLYNFYVDPKMNW